MAELKGILLAGGKGTRLYPMTRVASKQLQPIYDKPMVYYPLTTMLLAGVRDVLIISSPEDTPRFQDLLGDGSQWGIRLSYQVQPEPRGIAQALVIGEDFIGENPVFLMLGDNLIYGRLDFLRTAVVELGDGATVFAYRVRNPSEFGVVEFDASYQVLSIEEKPKAPKSDWAVPGLYLYGPGAAKKAHQLAPSGRGEYEITDLNRVYLADGTLEVKVMNRGVAWLDSGTYESLLAASQFVETIESRQGLKVACIEELAYINGWIDNAQMERLAQVYSKSSYGQYLLQVMKDAKRG